MCAGGCLRIKNPDGILGQCPTALNFWCVSGGCKWETWGIGFVSEGFTLEVPTAGAGTELWVLPGPTGSPAAIEPGQIYRGSSGSTSCSSPRRWTSPLTQIRIAAERLLARFDSPHSNALELPSRVSSLHLLLMFDQNRLIIAVAY